jgi:GntR family transcriptional regulator, transcriptional repressor for pyruvate dehydrogenase complex
MKASHSIAADFRQLIARGELKAGDPLPVESELVDQLGSSKGVIREALRILETEGLVEVRRGLGGGPRVRHPSISQATQGMGIYLQIGDVPVLDVWTARDRIIGGAVERLAGAHSEQVVAALDLCVNALGSLIGDFDAYYPHLLDVAETTVRVAGNATEHVLVVALRHIIAAELDAATRAVADVRAAVGAERFITAAWREVVDNIRSGHRKGARQAYDRQADLIRNGIAKRNPGITAVATVGMSQEPRELNTA